MASSSMALYRPCSLQSHPSRAFAMRSRLPRAPQRPSMRSSSRCSTITNSTTSSSNSSSCRRKGIFGREAELAELNRLRRIRPIGVAVVLGPSDCGKTAVLQQLCADQPDAVYIDCNMIGPTPEGLLEVLLCQLAAKVPEDRQEGAIAALSGVRRVLAEDLADDLSSLARPEKDAALNILTIPGQHLLWTFLRSTGCYQNLNAVYDALRELLAALERGRADDNRATWPLVVIDGADSLMGWTDSEYRRKLDTILHILVGSRCHVVMASSEYPFVDWLREIIRGDFWKTEVIGNFPAAVAREFLVQELEQRACSTVLDDQAWHKVFQVCGGNAGDLRRVAGSCTGGDWDAALEVGLYGELGRMEHLALGSAGWTPAQFADIMLQLLDAPHHAIPRSQAWMQLGRHTAPTTPWSQKAAGRAALQHLVAAKVLTVRPKSSWASDIPDEAFADDYAVVTAHSCLQLYCIGQLRGWLEQDQDA